MRRSPWAAMVVMAVLMSVIFGLASGARADTSPPAGGTPQITLPSAPGSAPVVTAPTTTGASGRVKAASVLGAVLLIGLLWAFSQGYGLMGGRVRSQRRLPSRDGPAAP